jgi:hypothetical protein
MSFSESCKSRAAIESKIVSGRSMRSIFLMIEMKEWMGFALIYRGSDGSGTITGAFLSATTGTILGPSHLSGLILARDLQRIQAM